MRLVLLTAPGAPRMFVMNEVSAFFNDCRRVRPLGMVSPREEVLSSTMITSIFCWVLLIFTTLVAPVTSGGTPKLLMKTVGTSIVALRVMLLPATVVLNGGRAMLLKVGAKFSW